MSAKPEIVKFLGKNKGGKLLHIGLCKDILGLTSKAKTAKAKIDKWDNFKVLHRKQNHQLNEKVNMEWERIFANLISDENLIPKIYKNAYNSRAETIQLKNGHRI